MLQGLPELMMSLETSVGMYLPLPGGPQALQTTKEDGLEKVGFSVEALLYQ